MAAGVNPARIKLIEEKPLGTVAVLGSANADIVVHVERRPLGGETLMGGDLEQYPGGKGANQAAAAARSGAHVVFLGAVGRDAHGEFLLRSLGAAGVDTSHVTKVDRPTGTALILVTPDGENSIVVSPGANGTIDIPAAEAVSEHWLQADVLVMNMEIPFETVQHVAARAAAAGVRVVLNVAPARAIEPALLRLCDPLLVNEHEARIALGDVALPTAAPFEALAQALLEAGARSVVITLGAQGALVAGPTGMARVPAHKVAVVDTTGAGDAFVGATAAELALGVPLEEALAYATAVSALAVTRAGAQSSYLDRSAVEQFITEQDSGSQAHQ